MVKDAGRIDYGMPSSHSQFMGFILGYYGWIVERVIREEDKILKVILKLCGWIGSFLVAYTRY